MVELKGSCLCEQVTFMAVGNIQRVSACYCRQCQKQNGGGPFYGVELQGELRVADETTLVWFDSSDRAQRAFCRACGSSLFWRAKADPSFFDVSMGALDDGHGLTLDAHIFVDRCPSHVSVPDTAPHFSEADILGGA